MSQEYAITSDGASYPVCETCGVDGCVCEWCDECDRNVNPYKHFGEWNGTGAHLSDIAMRTLEAGQIPAPMRLPRVGV